MFKKTVIAMTLVAFATPIAGAAFAGPGEDQLARLLGVAPGAYSVAQMIQLEQARRDKDQTLEAFILSQGADFANRADTASAQSNAPGAVQLAALVGVAPGSLSVSDLTLLQTALQENDTQAVAFILNGSNNGNSANDRGSVTPGKAQLAMGMGLDPAEFTTVELATKYIDSIN